MMLKRFAVCMALVCLCAGTIGQTSASKHWKADAKFGCWPSPVGQGVGLVTDVRTADGWGYYVGWWCPTDVAWHKNLAVTMHGSAPKFDTGMLTALLANNPADAQAALNAAADLARKPPNGNYVAQWDRLWEKGTKALDSTKPADPVWEVAAATAEDGTRPARGLTAEGTLGDQAPARAPSGAACTCKAFRIRSGAQYWCGWAGGPDRAVALCRRKTGA